MRSGTRYFGTVVLSLAALTLMFSSPLAEPTPTVSRLMDASVSMLDWGIYRAQEYMNTQLETFTGRGSSPVFGRYDGDSNRITFRIDGLTREEKSDSERRTWCEFLLREARSILGINPDTGRPTAGFHGYCAEFFSHTGYSTPDDQSDLGEQLDRIVRFEITVGSGLMAKDYLRCTAPLLGTEAYYVEIAPSELFRWGAP
ncbi:MAG: hypothetical protein ABIE42_08635 [Candidatus Eisenbacteria bacterium]